MASEAMAYNFVWDQKAAAENSCPRRAHRARVAPGRARNTPPGADQVGRAARAAEAGEGVFRYVVTPLDGDFFDGVGHVLDGDHQEALGDRHRRVWQQSFFTLTQPLAVS